MSCLEYMLIDHRYKIGINCYSDIGFQYESNDLFVCLFGDNMIIMI